MLPPLLRPQHRRQQLRLSSPRLPTGVALITVYLDREGVSADYERWRIALEDDSNGSATAAKRIRQLERELARKEKALAEAAALLVLKKGWRAC